MSNILLDFCLKACYHYIVSIGKTYVFCIIWDSMKPKAKVKKELPLWAALTIALLLVVGVSKMMVMLEGPSGFQRSLAAEKLPPLSAEVRQNQLSLLVYDGYLR